MTTRSRGNTIKTEAQNKAAVVQRQLDNRIFLLDATLIDGTSEDIQIISLRNPATEKLSKYLYSKGNKQFFEVLSFSEEHRSWFADSSVYPNGNVYITAPFDPLLWALYYIRLNSIDRCQPIDQTIVDDEFANAYLIADVLPVEQLSMIADQKGDASLKAFKFNEKKALIWLSLKCKKLANTLKESKFHIGAKSINYIKSEKTVSDFQNDGDFLSFAFGIVSDYITSELSEKLSDHLGIEKIKAPVSGKRKSLMELDNNTQKRIKSEGEFPTENISEHIVSPPTKEKKVSAKEKAMAKAAFGTKSISSFFSKK